jgi:hypothetical protein
MGEIMRNLIALSLVFSFGLFADDHADEPEYKPSKAEYYVSVFKKGQDMDDMMAWAEKWAKWASEGEAGEAFADYSAAILVPMYVSDADEHDLIWVGLNTNPEEQYKANDYWFNNGADLLAELPVTTPQVIDTWQRTVSETPSGQAGYVVYSDCKLGEGVSGEDLYNAYYAYAKAAQAQGDKAARKMIFPGAGSTPGWDYDYVQAVGTETIAGYGKNWTDFWSNTDDMPELKALMDLGGVCENERSYAVVPVK